MLADTRLTKRLTKIDFIVSCNKICGCNRNGSAFCINYVADANHIQMCRLYSIASSRTFSSLKLTKLTFIVILLLFYASMMIFTASGNAQRVRWNWFPRNKLFTCRQLYQWLKERHIDMLNVVNFCHIACAHKADSFLLHPQFVLYDKRTLGVTFR